MTSSIAEKKPMLPLYFLILVLPFLLFYWMLPFLSDKVIGSDYLRFSFWWQQEFQFALKTGSFPLYIPGFASGQSSSAMTLGQISHPLSYIASIMPGYWNGKAIEWNTFLKLLSIGFAQLVLFTFLQKMRINTLFSFILSFITVYNLRMVEQFRDGAPLEAYTAYLMLYAAIGWYFIRPSKLSGPLCIIGATYLLICSGHPEEMYYCLIGAGLFLLVAPFYLTTIFSESRIDSKTAFRFWAKTGFFLFLGTIMSSVYTLPFYFDFIEGNAGRMAQDYAWANDNMDTFLGTVNNFLLPLRSHVFVAFGGSSMILMAAILPVLRLFKIKIPVSIWIVWAILLFMFLHMQGSRTPVHRLMWQYFPLASSIRVAGRISLIMPFFMMLLLAWVLKADSHTFRIRLLPFPLRPMEVLAFISLVSIIIYYMAYIAGYYIFSAPAFLEAFHPYFPENFINIPFFWVESFLVITGAASFLLLIFYRISSGSSNKLIVIFLIAVTVLQMEIVLKYRALNWIEEKYPSPTYNEILQQKKVKLDFLYYAGFGMQSSVVSDQLKYSFMEPYLGKIFTQVVPVTSYHDVYEIMRRYRLPQQIFIEGYDLEKARKITEHAQNMKKGSVKLLYSSFNRLKFEVAADTPAIFSLSYPYSGNWHAWVNGKNAKIYRANGAAHAIEIPEGESIIDFRYWSDAFFWGVFLTCTAFTVIGLFVFIRGLKGRLRIIAVIIVLVIGTGVFMLWYDSLYKGDNLETEYLWTYTPPLEKPNLAYGKKLWLDPNGISANLASQELSLYGSRIVDGDLSQCSGYTSRLTESPAWFLDLNEIEPIKTVVFYESCQNQLKNEGPLNMLDALTRYSTKPDQNSSVNIRPLEIDLSYDGNKWSNAASVISPMEHYNPTRIVFEKPLAARYIRIKASGKSQLSFNEVEVYGP